jgi:hypothetical protein
LSVRECDGDFAETVELRLPMATEPGRSTTNRSRARDEDSLGSYLWHVDLDALDEEIRRRARGDPSQFEQVPTDVLYGGDVSDSAHLG